MYKGDIGLGRILPGGFPVSSGWLRQNGISKIRLRALVSQGTLERVGPFAYRWPEASGQRETSIDWRVALLSARYLLGWQVHLEGLTALRLIGKFESTPDLDDAAIGVSTMSGDARKWLSTLPLDRPLSFRLRRLFSREEDGLVDYPCHSVPSAIGAPFGGGAPALLGSSRERAILEMLAAVPRRVSFGEASAAMALLSGLDGATMQRLIRSCLSLKAKRLLRFFGDRYGHDWCAGLRWDEVDTRQKPLRIMSHGRSNWAYGLILPRELDDRRDALRPAGTAAEHRDG